MKIAIFVCYFWPFIGGTEKAVENLALALHSKGHNVKVFTPKVDFLKVDYSKFPFEVVETKKIFFPSKNVVFSKLKVYDEIIEEIKKFNPDIINCHGSCTSFSLSSKLAQIIDKPLTTTMHTKNRLVYNEMFKSKL
ncbi:glycosyltransferase family 4 protein, partial [Mycoplasma sp. AC157]